ncbi:hypothetical protein PSET11_02959 [Arthrobacter ulcerisalmonis]|uniref:Uncharacterized protein n=1 Tax=Arthrobacter ulcerisalmonis TaxID=2483813 RepID=A0A3P5XBV1_9MICC|nr:hypothetical protein [Arthrobacter ulcerisalmonis]VDC32150.1 hypothetical protein PSET11_02959 [Arthrobacter ulcerisalmonis]
MVDDTWRIEVDLLREGPEAENAAKYWAYGGGTRGRIAWEHKVSEIFGTINPSEAAASAAEYVVATYTGTACIGCGEVPEGVVVANRSAASSKLSGQGARLCATCEAAKVAAANDHRERVLRWIAGFDSSLPDSVEALSDVMLLDKLTQSDPFKDKRLRGLFLKQAGFSSGELGRLLRLGVLVPANAQQPANIEFVDDSVSYIPFEIDWHPAGEGTLDDRFEAIEQLTSQEIHSALGRFPMELETAAKECIVQEAERYLSLQLADRGIDEPTEAQWERFRESIVDAWSYVSLAQFYYAIWPACARAVDNKARQPFMGRGSVTGSAVNNVVKMLNEFKTGERPAKAFAQPYNLPLLSRTVSTFRIMLDLDPLSALEADVAEALGTDAQLLPAPEEILEGARLVHLTCLRSMPEEHAFVATMASLSLLVPHYDIETINAARAVFAAEYVKFAFPVPEVGTAEVAIENPF